METRSEHEVIMLRLHTHGFVADQMYRKSHISYLQNIHLLKTTKGLTALSAICGRTKKDTIHLFLRLTNEHI